MSDRRRVDLLLTVLAWTALGGMFALAMGNGAVRKPDACSCGPICTPADHCRLVSCPPAGKEKAKGERVDLAKAYSVYNLEYFEGRLPRDVIVRYADPGPNRMAATFKGEDGKLRIWIDPDLCAAPKVANTTLLHEMAHVSTWDEEFDNHGRRFKAEIRRLMLAGAFDDLL